tara:strand:+ start:595 stop:1185 length:591 start_codon:yes stop_codon:yes gene_type:complete
MGIKKIGILGGTFDPIHLAHLKLAIIAIKEYGLNEIIFIPAGTPWMKNNSIVTNATHRINMVKLAIEEEPLFKCSPIEILRTGNTYTIDTLIELGVKQSTNEYHLILGSDSYKQIHRWKNYQEILNTVGIILFQRKGDDFPKVINSNIKIIEKEIDNISSTNIRRKIQNNKSLNGLVPINVEEYILKNNLYRTTTI